MLRLPAEEAFPFLRGLTPLTADHLSTYLDRAGALRSLTPLVELLTLSAKKQPQGDARGRVAWLRPKIVGCLRRIYRVNISARWFISTFGSHEAQFVLHHLTSFYSPHSDAGVLGPRSLFRWASCAFEEVPGLAMGDSGLSEALEGRQGRGFGSSGQ